MTLWKDVSQPSTESCGVVVSTSDSQNFSDTICEYGLEKG